uniref:Uncharacterized protein n=1 Tax=Knipowitschia caucasica TaxID=637954 RepID=A0AAV2J9T3_KNICA
MNYTLDFGSNSFQTFTSKNTETVDPFLAAARMLRGGTWSKTWQTADDKPVTATSEPKELKDPQPCVRSGHVTTDRAQRPSDQSPVRLWRSGGRPNSRRFRRFKAPLLPAIAEI